MFDEYCQKSGVSIHKTVSDVEGIFLMKIRPEKINFGDQFRMDDPYGRDLVGDGYIMIFLRSWHDYKNRNEVPEKKERMNPKGFLYVEAIDPEDGQRYRYTGSVKVVGQKDRTAPAVQFNIKKYPNYDLNILVLK